MTFNVCDVFYFWQKNKIRTINTFFQRIMKYVSYVSSILGELFAIEKNVDKWEVLANLVQS